MNQMEEMIKRRGMLREVVQNWCNTVRGKKIKIKVSENTILNITNVAKLGTLKFFMHFWIFYSSVSVHVFTFK